MLMNDLPVPAPAAPPSWIGPHRVALDGLNLDMVVALRAAKREVESLAARLRAVATRLACDHSSTADEAYSLLDEILRFAAGHAKRRSGRIDDEVIAAAV